MQREAGFSQKYLKKQKESIRNASKSFMIFVDNTVQETQESGTPGVKAGGRDDSKYMTAVSGFLSLNILEHNRLGRF